MRGFLTLLAFLVVLPVHAQPQKTSDTGLSLDRIFGAGDFAAQQASRIAWQKDNKYTTLEGNKIVTHDPATGKADVLVPDHWLTPPSVAGNEKPLAIDEYWFSQDGSKLLFSTNTKRVWRVHSRGDFWVLDLTNRELRKLGGDAAPSTLMFATLSPDGKKAAYVRENNLYVQDLRDGKITPLTTTGSPTIINGTFDWVYEEELGLRNGFRWSDDSKQIAFWEIDQSGVKEMFLVRNSDGPYSRVISIRYPKTGEQNAAARIGVVRAEGGEPRWLDIPGDPREHYLAKMEWAGKDIAVQQFNRLQNTNRVFLADPASGKTRLIHTETDKAWVENENEVRWIGSANDGSKKLVWLSERSGWRHVYTIPREGGSPTPITKGLFDVEAIEEIDEKGGWLYYIASPDDATRRYLYRVSLKGGEPQRLTPSDKIGTNTYSLSPDAEWGIHTYSTINTPPVVSLVHLPDHKTQKVMVDNAGLNKKLQAVKNSPTELIKVKIDDGVELDAWVIKPPGFDSTKKYPVLFYVYGEPAGQTVLDRWGGGKHLWHTMLANEGYVVVSVDNRGTPAPRGREWRKCIYRQVGVLASADQAAAVRALQKQWPWIDPSRVGVWGWSGGGSMTLNAMFRYPDLYHVGMSVAPVPNQRHYDTIYQERYMGLPSDNVEGYRNGSPIHLAQKLKGNLFLMHGTGDDNCHYLGMESLINELITHNKQFQMMSYPDRAHGINEGKNTTRHVYGSLTRFLKANLEAGPK